MKSNTFIAAISFAGLSIASPTPTTEERAASSCGQWDSATAGAYVLYNNLWGESSASSGSQCFTLDSTSPVGWTSTWSWSGGPNSVKSYSNAVYNGYSPMKLSTIGSIPTSWSWSYTGSNIVADVSYDLFTSSAASTSNEEYEIMVWLAALGGAGPIASSYGSDGKPVANGQITAGGSTFNFYYGSNGVQKQTFSFVASSPIQSFSGDLNVFLKYLTSNGYLDSSQYLVSLGAGTEPFTGSNAVFKVSSYSVSVSTGGTGVSTPTSTAKPTSTTTHTTLSTSASVKPTTTAQTTTSAVSQPTGSCAAKYAQCGGQGFSGPTCCVSGSKCTFSNQWYSQCV